MSYFDEEEYKESKFDLNIDLSGTYISIKYF